MTVSSCRYGSGPDRDGSAGDGPPAGSGSGSGQDTAGPDSGQHHPETRHTDGCGHHPGQHRLHGTFATQQVCGSDPTDYLTVTEGREAAGRCKESNAEVYGSVRQSDPNRFISHDALLSIASPVVPPCGLQAPQTVRLASPAQTRMVQSPSTTTVQVCFPSPLFHTLTCTTKAAAKTDSCQV